MSSNHVFKDLDSLLTTLLLLHLIKCIRTAFGNICLFGVLPGFQHCTGHITMGSWKGRGNQYIEFVRVLYCKLLTNSKQLPAFPLEAMTGIEPRPQRWEARVLPLCHCGPLPSKINRHLEIQKVLCKLYKVQDNPGARSDH